MSAAAPPLLITGGHGTLGVAFARMCGVRALAHRVTGRDQLDICDRDDVLRALDRHRPWAVVNAAGFVRVDDAEGERVRCLRENATGAAVVAAACASAGVPLVVFSSDLVFDGAKGEPYGEEDRPRPLSVYGRSKLAAEERVLEAYPSALVVRTSAFFGPWDVHNFVTASLASLTAGIDVQAAGDALVSPTYLPDLVNECLDLLIDGASGLWHLSNGGAISWADLARRAARLVGLDDAGVIAVPSAAMPWRAPRPRYSALASTRGAILPQLDDALTRYLGDRRAALAEAS